MLHKDKGIVLRAVKYGETSIIATIFTELAGVHAYIIQGVRSSSRKKSSNAGLLQPSSLLELVAEHRPNRHLQRLREFRPAYIYSQLQGDIIKNSIGVFSIELLQKLLPQEEPMPALFDFSYKYFTLLDQSKPGNNANYPLFFIIQCGRMLGYNILGSFHPATPYLDAIEGTFTAHPPAGSQVLTDSDISGLAAFLSIKELADADRIRMNAAMRNRILDWYILFLQHHTQHLKDLRSPEVLRAILH
jgi:DNA repair protein RecO (recombination protein O)